MLSRLTIKDLVLEIVRKEHPFTIGELAENLSKRGQFDLEEFVEVVRGMVEAGNLALRNPQPEVSSVLDYLLNPILSAWLWALLIFTYLALTIIVIAPNYFPFNVGRLILGSILIFFSPGYVTLRALQLYENKDTMECYVLSVGVSIAIVPLIGLFLYFTVWGVNTFSTTTSVALFISFVAVASVLRESSRLQKLSRDGKPPWA